MVPRIKKKLRSNSKQIIYMCQYMHAHQDFATGDYNTPEEANQEDEQWLHLQAALNELGPHRSVEQWKIAWRDQKRKARKESAAVNAQTAIMPTLSERSLIVLDTIAQDNKETKGYSRKLARFRGNTSTQPSSSNVTPSWHSIQYVKRERSSSPELPESPESPPSPTIKISISPTMISAPEPTSTNATFLPTLTILPLTRSPTPPTIKIEPSTSSSAPPAYPEPVYSPPPPPSEYRPAQPMPSRPAPRARRRRVIVSRPIERLLNAQLQMNSLMKELIKEVRQSNHLNAEQNRILMRRNQI